MDKVYLVVALAGGVLADEFADIIRLQERR